ncbi:alpha-endosulfine isoform X1 [Microtus ochrogaster]|uniref:Alpha-endosulfine n=1 Tax=Microtus ochrogaster TaxID=79684 RepID=A0ABM0L1E7_MICOH|nr:alpha-endosulfine isoform X1 [Microtus ochrogaster]
MSQKQEENPAEETGEEKQDTQEKEGVLPERAEEAKLKAKYPSLGQKPGGSDFLMKRLQKGQKYFDSGDYNMAKAKMKNKQLPSAGPDKNLVTGDHIPTPQDLPQSKSSLVTSKLAGLPGPLSSPSSPTGLLYIIGREWAPSQSSACHPGKTFCWRLRLKRHSGFISLGKLKLLHPYCSPVETQK